MDKQIVMMKMLAKKHIPFRRNSIASMVYSILADIESAFHKCFDAMERERIKSMVTIRHLSGLTGFKEEEVVSAINTLLEASEIEFSIDTSNPNLVHFHLIHQEEIMPVDVEVVQSEEGVSPTQAAVKKKSKKPAARKRERIEYPEEFEMTMKEYPKRKGGMSKKAGYKAWAARIAEGESVENLLQATKNYFIASRESRNTSFIMMPSTFFGPNERYADYLNLDVEEMEGKSTGEVVERVESNLSEEDRKAVALKRLQQLED